jgi:hypothetical protein
MIGTNRMDQNIGGESQSFMAGIPGTSPTCASSTQIGCKVALTAVLLLTVCLSNAWTWDWMSVENYQTWICSKAADYASRCCTCLQDVWGLAAVTTWCFWTVPELYFGKKVTFHTKMSLARFKMISIRPNASNCFAGRLSWAPSA